MESKLTFGEWIEDRYLRAGFTQAEFAEAINVAQSTVSGWVSGGKRPRRRVIPLIAKVLESTETEVYVRAGYTRRERGWFEEYDEKTGLTEEEAAGFEIDPYDPLLEVSAAYGDKLTLAQKEMLAQLIKELARKGEIEL